MLSKYLLILVWAGLVALAQRKLYREEVVNGKPEWRIHVFPAVLAMVPVIWMASTRGWFADTGGYIRKYREMPKAFSGLSEYYTTLTKDKGFYLTSAVIKCVTGLDYKFYLFLFALVQGMIVVWFFRKYSWNYAYSFFLFIASTDYISWMFNGIRQFAAVTIILLGTPFMLKKTKRPVLEKYLPLFAIIVVASFYHKSALLMIPLVVAAQGEAWNRRTMLILACSILAVAFVSRFVGTLDDVLQGTQYETVISEYTSWNDNGTHPLRVLVYSVPAILSFIGRERIRTLADRTIHFCVNMSIISMGLYLISMFTSGIFMGRLPIYCSLYSYILLPWEIDNLFEGISRKLVKYGAVIGYLGFYFFAMHFQNGLL